MITKTIFILSVLLTVGCTKSKSEKENNIRSAASVETPTEEKPSSDYCAAIRGNGELAPAHWSAMSRIVENIGMPKAMSGGSSATITMFYLESIAANPFVETETNPVLKKRKQALLLKTLPIYKKILSDYEGADNAYKKIAELQASSSMVAGGLRSVFTAAKNRRAIEKAVRKYGYLFNPEFLKNLRTNFSFAQNEVKNSVSVFGSFNAETDDNLFFRPGLVDFKYFALLIGQIGDFYAGNVNAAVMEEMGNFLNDCSIQSYGKIWPSKDDTECANLFTKIALENIKEKHSSKKIAALDKNSQILKKIGSNITAFPTTSIVKGKSYTKYLTESEKYKKGISRKYKDFSVDFADVKFGYWGPSKSYLKELSKNLNKIFPNDLKSNNFYSLGSANWFEVLSSSPAEPGLSNFQKIMDKTNPSSVNEELLKGHMDRWNGLNYKENIISAGGWSDLHPTLVLRAHGCENIVYLTRTDGETIFGQQVFIRLNGLTEAIPFWKTIDKNNKTGWDVAGTPAEKTPWHKLYNLKNENSSMNVSIKEADAVYCTNWNAFNVFKNQLDELWYDSYNSPVLLKKGAPEDLSVTDLPANGALPGCI